MTFGIRNLFLISHGFCKAKMGLRIVGSPCEIFARQIWVCEIFRKAFMGLQKFS